MITIVNVLAGIAIASGAVLAALLVRRAFRKDRAHGRRMARYEALSDPSRPYVSPRHSGRGSDPLLKGLRDVLGDDAGDLDLPPDWDEHVTDNPKKPQREEGL